MRVGSSRCVLVVLETVVVMLVLLLPKDTTTTNLSTKPQRNIIRRKPRMENVFIKSFGERTEMGKEMKKCGKRRVVQSDGSVEEIATPCQPDSITPTVVTVVDRKGGKAKCGKEYEMEAGTKLKANLVGKAQKCEMLFMAAEGAELEVTCKKFKTSSCDQEILFMSDEENFEGSYCNTDKPDGMKGKDMMYLSYDRDRKKKYKGSKITCTIKAVAGNGGGGGGDGSGSSQAPNCAKKCGAARLDSGTDRIVGGSEAKVGEYPWMITYGIKDNGGFFPRCGGSIITTTHILTAAHCVEFGNNPPTLLVVAGEHDLSITSESNTQSRTVDFITIHPKYDSAESVNDIAILKLTKALKFTKGVQPVCLSPTDELHVGDTATVTGWGTTSSGGSASDVLLEVAVKVYTNDECADAYSDYSTDIPDTMVCAAARGKDSCQGDSGGPMVFLNGGAWQEIGIVSWGIGCAEPEYPGVYTRVSKFVDWIVSTVEAQNGSC